MRRAALLILLCSLWTGPASPGPWPLARGEGHLSLGLEADPTDGRGLYATLYAEKGIGAGRVLGLDLGHSEDSLDKAVLFMRRPFGPEGRNTVHAWEIGIGAVDDEAALRAGLSTGRGFTLAGHPAWMSIETRAALYDTDGAGRIETDLTLGAATGHGHKWMVQIQMAAPSDRSAYVKIAPAWAFRAGEGRHLLLGVTAGAVNASDTRLSVGLWQRF